MMTADFANLLVSPKSIVEMHCSSTGHHEDMTDSMFCECLNYIVCKPHEKFLYRDGFFF